MAEKSLAEEHKEEYDKLLMEEFEKGKEATLTDDEILEKEVLEEGIEIEVEDLDKEETYEEKLEKEILEEESLEDLLGADALAEKIIRANRLNNFLMNQAYDASLSYTGIQPIMNLEEELEKIPLEEKEGELDFSYNRLEDKNDDAYTKMVENYESGNRDKTYIQPKFIETSEERLAKQGKLYHQPSIKPEKDDVKFIEFKQSKEMGYDNNLSSKAKRGIY